MKTAVRSTPSEREYWIKGDFTAADEDVFYGVYQSVKTQPEYGVVFNLSQCTFIDSAAIGMLILAYAEANKRRRASYIRFANQEIRAALNLAGADKYFRFQNAK